MSNVAPIPSSASHGFFQAKPKLENQFHEDSSYSRTLDFFLPTAIRQSTAGPLAQFGAKVLSPQFLLWLQNAEQQPPTLVLRNSFGSPRNELVTSEGWRCSQDFALREGLVASGYENAHGVHTRLVQFAKIHLFCGSSSSVTCPAAMQDGAAKLIRAQLRDPSLVLDGKTRAVLESAYKRLTSRDPSQAWTSGQWMTERPGGSDVSATETRAKLLSEAEIQRGSQAVATDGSPLGPWSVDGFKWFSSATDANMSVFLAKTAASDRVSLFFAPVRRNTDCDASLTEFNGVFPQRLKNKLGTKALPTAELELKGMRAYLLGKEGSGTKEISPVLNVTRVHNAIGSVGGLGRGLAISRAFARVRRALGSRLLTDVPAHVRGMAHQHVEYRGHNMMAFFVAYLLGITEQDEPSTKSLPLVASPSWTSHLLRLLTPVAKAMTALAAVDGLRFCMESLGGLGFLENEDVELNVAKVFRDANVLPIWEGTTDVMAADTVRVLKGRGAKEVLEALNGWTNSIIANEAASAGLDLKALSTEVKLVGEWIREKDVPELLYRGRELLERLNWIVTTSLLAADAARDGDAVAMEVARRWLARRDKSLAESLAVQPWEERARWDREIVCGEGAKVETRSSKM
ncbi:hypothetical protein B0A50_01935 [Salinomyces thailandicus]|uniref:Acyl-CoA dehydrogenase n=1 Tax=Salinomyces thailandicus TaxID=706561 RepID=A0A4U0U7G8_9PEZI|nr:hypothetical protein B0A50_01935 [Salinomyces thailandica]